MKLKSLAILAGLFAALMFTGCSVNEDVLELNPTELEVTVFDKFGARVSNAQVSLYRNLRNLELKQEEVTSALTNNSGIAKFSGLQPVNYYFLVTYSDNDSVYTNYGRYDRFNDDGDRLLGGYNYQLGDLLAENGITNISVFTTISRPLEAANIRVGGLDLLYQGESNSDFALDSLTEIYFMFFQDYSPNASFNSQISSIFYGQSLFFPDRPFENEVFSPLWIDGIFQNFSVQAILNSEISQGSFLPEFSIQPSNYDPDNFMGSIYDEDYGFSLNQVLIEEINSGEYRNRMPIGEMIIGNDIYDLELKIEWR